jgi:hypothetical protein
MTTDAHTRDTDYLDEPIPCERPDCDQPADPECPGWEYVADPETGEAVDRDVYECPPHFREPSHLRAEAVAVYWEKIAAGEPTTDAQAAAHATHHDAMQQRRAEVAANVRHAPEAHHDDESYSDG